MHAFYSKTKFSRHLIFLKIRMVPYNWYNIICSIFLLPRKGYLNLWWILKLFFDTWKSTILPRLPPYIRQSSWVNEKYMISLCLRYKYVSEGSSPAYHPTHHSTVMISRKGSGREIKSCSNQLMPWRCFEIEEERSMLYEMQKPQVGRSWETLKDASCVLR